MLCQLDSCRTECPRNREVGVWLVGAEVARLDATREDFSQPGIAMRDPFHHRFDRLEDALPGALRGGRRAPITSTEPNGAREFRGECTDLLLRLLGAIDVAGCLGLFQFYAQLQEPTPVSYFGVLIEHLARVTQTRDLNARLVEVVIHPRQAMRGAIRLARVALARAPPSQIEDVEFGRGMTQQMGEVFEPLGVL